MSYECRILSKQPGLSMLRIALVVNSTTQSTRWIRQQLIYVCLSFHGIRFKKTKAAVKLHTLLDLRGNILAFIHITNGLVHEVNVLDVMPFEAGNFYIMDGGFLDVSRLYSINQAQAFFCYSSKVKCRNKKSIFPSCR